MTSILLKNGTALIHTEDDHVNAVKTDILIQGNKIVKIGIDIKPANEQLTEVFDCTDKLISPGFVDTHHHLWQTQLKCRHADELLFEYMTRGNWQSSNFTDADFYWGQMGGCMEAIWAGTTTVLDHAHMNHTPNASRFAISATVSSGLRSIFGYCPILRIDSWNPLQLNYNFLEGWVMDTFEQLGKEAPFGEGRVALGLAFDLYFLPQDVVMDVFRKAKAMGVKIITTHFLQNAYLRMESTPQLLASYGLLDESIVFSHANNCSAKDAERIRKANAHFSSTPSTELQMGLGIPECWRDDLQSNSSLGIDCHATNIGSIPSEMRIGLQAIRGITNAKFEAQNKTPSRILQTVESAFNLGTIQGARALRMADQIGSIAVGKLADLVIFDATSPGMVCGAFHDPVAAVVLHSSPSDIEAVMVDGVWRKRNGVLLPVKVEPEARVMTEKDELKWSEVAAALKESWDRIQLKIKALDFDEADRLCAEVYRLDKSTVADHL